MYDRVATPCKWYHSSRRRKWRRRAPPQPKMMTDVVERLEVGAGRETITWLSSVAFRVENERYEHAVMMIVMAMRGDGSVIGRRGRERKEEMHMRSRTGKNMVRSCMQM